eukprot:scaffold113171_cov28-Tisochrysis_lutea.AAC.2
MSNVKTSSTMTACQNRCIGVHSFLARLATRAERDKEAETGYEEKNAPTMLAIPSAHNSCGAGWHRPYRRQQRPLRGRGAIGKCARCNDNDQLFGKFDAGAPPLICFLKS